MFDARWLALTLVALTLAACGSSNEGSGGSSSAGSNESSSAGSGPASDELSRAELIARGDRICDETSVSIRALGAPTSLADVERFTEQSAAATDEGVDRLKALTPPASVKADYETFLTRLEMVAEQAHDVADAAKSQDMSTVIAAIGDLAGDEESRRLARKIGFRCCRGGTGPILPPGGATPEMPEIPSQPAAP